MMDISTQDNDFLKGLTVLFVEDEDDAREQFTRFIQRIVGFLVTAKDGEEGLAAYHAHRPQIVITDIQMPKMDGLAMAAAIRAHDRSVRIIVLTAFEQVDYLKTSINMGVDRYLTKPVDGFLLHDTLLECARSLRDVTESKQAEDALRQAHREIDELREQLQAEDLQPREEVGVQGGLREIIGVSTRLQQVMHRIRQVAGLRSTVLLTGETGTGKGRFARALHEASKRRDRPFVHVNCSAFPSGLIESELFGREKGAFTGATARQIGRFELANGGTIFLDEIGDLPLELQAKLLKVIEEGEFERLGSPLTVKVDVRIVAATNRHLEEEVAKGRFREDLFYRLNVFPIVIPPLRERREDIPVLVRFYAEQFSSSHGRGIKEISHHTMKALEEYDWPGNVRELMNVIERAVIVSDGPRLRLAADMAATSSPSPKGTVPAGETTGDRGLSAVEQEHILRILRETGWRIEGDRGAARLLGLKPSTLRARMRKLGISRPGSHQGPA